jgi:hypothetical protein
VRIIWHFSADEPVEHVHAGRVGLTAPDEICVDVHSASDPNLVYQVSRFPDGRWHCTCKDFAHRGETRDCKHIVQIKRRMGLMPEPEPLAGVPGTVLEDFAEAGPPDDPEHPHGYWESGDC